MTFKRILKGSINLPIGRIELKRPRKKTLETSLPAANMF